MYWLGAATYMDSLLHNTHQCCHTTSLQRLLAVEALHTHAGVRAPVDHLCFAKLSQTSASCKLSCHLLAGMTDGCMKVDCNWHGEAVVRVPP